MSPAPPSTPGRLRCARCRRPLPSCLCRWITEIANEVPLLLLQHPAEADAAKGSARLLQLSLQRCQVEVGEVFDTVQLAGWLATGRPLLLYPATGDATGRHSASGAAAPAPTAEPAAAADTRLVLLDGSWRQSRALLRLNPLLQELPRWPLPDPPPSRYHIRRAQRPEQRSTLEAACLAMGCLEGQPDRYTPLLAAFDGWVAAELQRAAAGASRYAEALDTRKSR